MQQSAKLQNFTDFIKKKIKNLQNLRIRRTLQKCTKKIQKKSRDLQDLQISAELNRSNFSDVRQKSDS